MLLPFFIHACQFAPFQYPDLLSISGIQRRLIHYGGCMKSKILAASHTCVKCVQLQHGSFNLHPMGVAWPPDGFKPLPIEEK